VTDTAPASPPNSVCLLRLSALGDVCNHVPLVRALQRAWPETAISWIIGRGEYRLVGALEDVEFIVVDKNERFGGLGALRRAVGGRRFDVLLLTQVSERATALALALRARRRIGFDRARSRNLHGMVVGERIEAVAFQHQVHAFLQFARHFGIDTDGIDRRLPIDEADRAFAVRHQPEAGHAVIISPASSHPGRNWHAEGYATVADWIVRRGREVILMGGPSEAERALGSAIEAAMHERVTNLIGRDTLQQALAMYERAACVISPDSGPAHFADAMGTPVVGLYAATWARRSGPLDSLEHTVDRFPEAARRFAGREPEELRWGKRLELPGVMALITPDMVIEKLERLLPG
jgi:heptosyltransferase I